MAKIHYGPPLRDMPMIPFHTYIYEHLEKDGDKPCMINASNDTSASCSDVTRLSKGFARGLYAMGMRTHDVICVYMHNSVELACVVLGSMEAGATVNTINISCTAYELRHYFKEVNPKFVVTDEPLLENVMSAVNFLSIKPKIITKESVPNYTSLQIVSNLTVHTNDVSTTELPEIDDVRDHVALILFSSGTTGLPKGVMLTHYNMVAFCQMKFEYSKYLAPMQMNCIEVCPLPMHHSGGLFQCLFSGVPTRRTCLFFEKYSFDLLLKSIDKYKPGGIFLPATVVIQIAKYPVLEKYDVSTIKYCRIGGAGVDRETQAAFRRKVANCEILYGYGLTENIARILGRDPSLYHKASSVGKPIAGGQVKVIDPDTGRLLGPMQQGEIIIKSPAVTKGYINRPEATRKTLDSDGWLHTGDGGYYDDDDCFYIVDRLKELIKYKGNQVAPAELEAALLEHPDIMDAGVCGIPDATAGELPRAYVVCKEGAILTEAKVKKYVEEKMAYYKWLRGGVAFIDEIPRLSTGKILRRHLRDLATKSKI